MKNLISPAGPSCPQCRSTDLQLEDVATARHQCRRCGWRCRIDSAGNSTDWLSIGTAGTAKGNRRPMAHRTRTKLQTNPTSQIDQKDLNHDSDRY